MARAICSGQAILPDFARQRASPMNHSTDSLSAGGWCSRGLVITVSGPGSAQFSVHVTRPFARIGSDLSADVRLPQGELLPCHLLLHATREGIYCLGLASSTPSGWLTPKHRVEIGPYRIKAVFDDDGPPPALQAGKLHRRGGPPGPYLRVSDARGQLGPVEVTVDRRLTVIGRRSPSSFRLGDPTVSRVHCIVYWNGEALWVIDALSGNGTLLDQDPVDAAVWRPGQELTVGTFRMQFLRLPESPEASAANSSSPIASAPRPVASAPREAAEIDAWLLAPREQDDLTLGNSSAAAPHSLSRVSAAGRRIPLRRQDGDGGFAAPARSPGEEPYDPPPMRLAASAGPHMGAMDVEQSALRVQPLPFWPAERAPSHDGAAPIADASREERPASAAPFCLPVTFVTSTPGREAGLPQTAAARCGSPSSLAPSQAADPQDAPVEPPRHDQGEEAAIAENSAAGAAACSTRDGMALHAVGLSVSAGRIAAPEPAPDEPERQREIAMLAPNPLDLHAQTPHVQGRHVQNRHAQTQGGAGSPLAPVVSAQALAAIDLQVAEPHDRPRRQDFVDSTGAPEWEGEPLNGRSALTDVQGRQFLSNVRSDVLIEPFEAPSDFAITDAERQLLCAVRLLGRSHAANVCDWPDGFTQGLLAVLSQAVAQSRAAAQARLDLFRLLENASLQAPRAVDRGELESPESPPEQECSARRTLLEVAQAAKPIAGLQQLQGERLIEAIQDLERRLPQLACSERRLPSTESDDCQADVEKREVDDTAADMTVAAQNSERSEDGPPEISERQQTRPYGTEFHDPNLERLASFCAEQGASKRRRRTLWTVTGALAVASMVAIGCAIWL